MRTFKPGDLVRIVCGKRAGEVTTVLSPLIEARGSIADMNTFTPWPDGAMVHEIAIRSLMCPWSNVFHPPGWLELYWEGKDASDQTLAAILDGVRGVKTKERTE
jgi:hypothetical protein